ncbi:MAG TPA: peptidylprolyl isomerase, partial [bacterium]|nr:peptidylprolyl isomerase [bacterium]
ERKKRVDTKTLDTLLLEHNIPYSRWKQIVENEIKVQYVLDQEFAKDLVISASEIRSYYTQNEGSFVVPEKVRVRHIVTDTLEKAHEVHERLLKGENFAKMAVNHSQSPDRTKGGDLGYFSRGNFPKEFDDTCFGLQKGEISPIVKSDYGYHIFKLLDRQPPGRTSLLEASSVIYQKLFEEKLNKKYGEWITHARTEVTINTNTETLKGFFL